MPRLRCVQDPNAVAPDSKFFLDESTELPLITVLQEHSFLFEVLKSQRQPAVELEQPGRFLSFHTEQECFHFLESPATISLAVETVESTSSLGIAPPLAILDRLLQAVAVTLANGEFPVLLVECVSLLQRLLERFPALILQWLSASGSASDLIRAKCPIQLPRGRRSNFLLLLNVFFTLHPAIVLYRFLLDCVFLIFQSGKNSSISASVEIPFPGGTAYDFRQFFRWLVSCADDLTEEETSTTKLKRFGLAKACFNLISTYYFSLSSRACVGEAFAQEFYLVAKANCEREAGLWMLLNDGIDSNWLSLIVAFNVIDGMLGRQLKKKNRGILDANVIAMYLESVPNAKSNRKVHVSVCEVILRRFLALRSAGSAHCLLADWECSLLENVCSGEAGRSFQQILLQTKIKKAC